LGSEGKGAEAKEAKLDYKSAFIPKGAKT